jgi:hypothetical protein
VKKYEPSEMEEPERLGRRRERESDRN